MKKPAIVRLAASCVVVFLLLGMLYLYTACNPEMNIITPTSSGTGTGTGGTGGKTTPGMIYGDEIFRNQYEGGRYLSMAIGHSSRPCAPARVFCLKTASGSTLGSARPTVSTM